MKTVVGIDRAVQSDQSAVSICKIDGQRLVMLASLIGEAAEALIAEFGRRDAELKARLARLEEALREAGRSNGVLCRSCGDRVEVCDASTDPDTCAGGVARRALAHGGGE